MTPRKLAHNYLRFWAASVPYPSMNAPIELHRFLGTMPAHERNNARAALASVADGEAAPILPDAELLAWLAYNPQYLSLGDEILMDKKSPKTMVTLLRNIYAASQRQLRVKVQAWLQSELDSFNY